MSVAAIPPSRSERRWDSLDALRGIAAFLVLTFHCAQLSPGFAARTSPFGPGAWLDPWTWLKFTPLRLFASSGPAAVVLFFVLSGFVLSLPFLRTGRRLGYAEFAIKRVLRIYPPFAAAILLSAALYAVVRPTPIPGASEWFGSVLWDRPLSWDYVLRNLMMTGLRPDMTLDLVMWSLVHELRISLVFPLLFLLTRRYPWASAATSMAVAVACTAALGGHEATDLGSSLMDTLRFVPMFVAGIIIAGNLDVIRAYLARLPDIASACLWLGAIALLMFPGMSVSNYYDFVWGAGAITLMVLTIASVRADRLLSMAPLCWLGRVSYSLYLIHVPLMLALLHLTYGWLPLWVVVVSIFPLAMAGAELMYLAVEAPSIRLGRHLAGRARAAAHPAGRPLSPSGQAEPPSIAMGVPAGESRR